MTASIRQMANRRKVHGISRREIQRMLGCSESWLRWLEAGYYRGPVVHSWTERYAEALDSAIAERKAASK